MKTSAKLSWLLWFVISLIATGILLYGITFKTIDNTSWQAQARSLYLPNTSSNGHYQIELACEVCHPKSGATKKELHDACLKCHADELKEARDSHSQKKFTDPRNADRAKLLDAANCITCHIEHKPGVTDRMGVTLPPDNCVICHDDIAKDRPSHKGMKFDTCASAGCHRYHDNRALYENFLLKNADKPALSNKPILPSRNFLEIIEELSDYPIDKYPATPLEEDELDWPEQAKNQTVVDEWLATAHAEAGVNCSACHQADGKNWSKQAPDSVCQTCHAAEVKGFTSGRHGMRIVQKLPPMTPADARIPMRADAHNKQLGCSSCHAAHRYDVKKAAVDACLACHNDQHSLAYPYSGHYKLWQKEIAGKAPAGSGVSCASCHMPRIDFTTPDDVERILVQHNQNDNLRPNEKMIRPVCLRCHNLADSIDALADPTLINNNFQTKPAVKIKSIQMAIERDIKAQQEKQKKTPANVVPDEEEAEDE